MPNILATGSNGKSLFSMPNILATETWNLKADNSETYVYIDRRSDLRQKTVMLHLLNKKIRILNAEHLSHTQ